MSSSRTNLEMHSVGSNLSLRLGPLPYRNLRMKVHVLLAGQPNHRRTSNRLSETLSGKPGSLQAYLERIMTMIPGSAILNGFEFVSVAIAWGNRTLSNGIYTVILDGI